MCTLSKEIFNGLTVLGSWTGMSAQFVNLTHSQLTVRDGETVVFNCSTSNSTVLAWSTGNTNYIDDRVEVVATFNPGTIYQNNNVEVLLLSWNPIDTIIVSQLSIQVSLELGKSLVTCHNSGMNTSQNATFLFSGIYNI